MLLCLARRRLGPLTAAPASAYLFSRPPPLLAGANGDGLGAPRQRQSPEAAALAYDAAVACDIHRPGAKLNFPSSATAAGHKHACTAEVVHLADEDNHHYAPSVVKHEVVVSEKIRVRCTPVLLVAGRGLN